MATYLSNPVVTVNSVDLTSLCQGATFTYRKGQLESTAFGQTSRSYVPGLEENEVTLDLYMSYATSETYQTLKSLLGVSTTITIKPTSAVDSATNPKQVLTGCTMFELPTISATLGELSTISVTWVGGSWSEDTTNP